MNNLLSKRIHKYLSNTVDESRAYIGASSIGNPCYRAIWYGLNYPEYKAVTIKQKITFEIGKRLEAMILQFLYDSGMNIDHSDIFECDDYHLFQGKPDSICFYDDTEEPIALIEVKTTKNSEFNIFKKKGLRLWKPEYYDQVQSYMGMGKIKLCYVVVLNKDTSDLNDELIKFDNFRYQELIHKALFIGNSTDPPKRIHDSPSYIKCKACFYREKCHE